MSSIIILDSDLQERPNLEALGLGNVEVVRYSQSHTNLNLGEHDRAYYFLSLEAGGLKYQSDLILHNKNVSQWLILVTSPKRTWGLEASLAGVEASVKILSVYGMTDAEIKSEIASVPVMHKRTCLIYSKRRSAGKRTVAAFWREHCGLDWEIETCEGREEVLNEKCAGIPKVVIMGRNLQDFSLSKPQNLETNPAFLFYPYDKDVQSCMDAGLWSRVRLVLAERKWAFNEHYENFYVGSALYEGWLADSKGPEDFSQMKLVEGFVMWDSFGLPMLRSEYTAENVAEFLGQFHALKDIAADFLH